jgi:hypothetical protein
MLAMDKTKMISEVCIYFAGGNRSKFARLLGMKPQAIDAWFTRASYNAELIKQTFPEISGDWLLTGEGEMLLADRSELSDTQRAYYQGQIDILREALGLGKNINLQNVKIG